MKPVWHGNSEETLFLQQTMSKLLPEIVLIGFLRKKITVDLF